MTRSNLLRNVLLFSAAGVWVFLLLCLGSFHPTDWPSHTVEPHPPTGNLCGSGGAYVAYYIYLAIGQGIFPVLFFTGVCLVLEFFDGRVRDLWMRAVGLLLITFAFAAAVHHFKPGTPSGFPEGQGGIIGIGLSTFLREHFGTAGSWLILLVTILIGLLLAADDLVLKAPAVMGAAFSEIKSRTPALQAAIAAGIPGRWNIAALPKLPSLPWFVTRDAEAERTARLRAAAKPVARGKKAPAADDGEVDAVGTFTAGKSVAAGKRDAAQTASTAVSNQAVAATLAVPEDDEVDGADAAGDVDLYEGEEDNAVGDEAEYDESAEYEDEETAGEDVGDENGDGDDDDDPPVELEYDDDHSQPAPTAADQAYEDDADPAPAEAATVPPPDEQAVPVEQAAPPPKMDVVVKLPAMLKPRQVSPPQPPPKELGEYHLPPWDILGDPEYNYAESQEAFVREQAAILEQALREFNIDAKVVAIDTGPVITMYEIALAKGIKVSAISALSNDIQRSMKAETVRIVAPIPGKDTVGIEVPNAQKEKVRLKELMQNAPDAVAKMDIPLYLGKDASGEPLITDLGKMPHCLIAGTTGSGKSVCINSIIMSIMYRQRPDMVKLILVDPKVVEMAPFKDIPHLMCPVINDATRATSVLEWACQKMDERYEFLAEAGVRNIAGYNKLSREELVERFEPSNEEEEAKIPKKLPYIVIIIDELADLMMTSGKEVEAHIVRLAQKARAVGIHLVIATQRPQANVVTGLIKANMPSKIAFRVSSRMDSRIVLDQNGADLLLGQGDMLFLPPGASKPTRSQGTYIDDKEIRDSVKLVGTLAEAQYEPELVQIKASAGVDEEAAKDELFDAAVRVVLETKRGSVSLLQRRLTIGYSRASRLIEAMAAANILGTYKGSQAREVNITVEDWEAMRAQMTADAEDGMTV